MFVCFFAMKALAWFLRVFCFVGCSERAFLGPFTWLSISCTIQLLRKRAPDGPVSFCEFVIGFLQVCCNAGLFVDFSLPRAFSVYIQFLGFGGGFWSLPQGFSCVSLRAGS